MQQRLFSLLCACAVLACPYHPAAAGEALPVGGQVTAGSAGINVSGHQMNVTQKSDKAAINWQSFSIGKNASVDFVQPSSSSVILNRVTGSERSVIEGALNANGQVFLLNSNGVLVAKDASINTAGLVASTMSLSDEDFETGQYRFDNHNAAASVINRGAINVDEGGYVALLGRHVSNEGVIRARMGTVALASGEEISLNFNDNSLVNVTVDKATLGALVENRQAIYADGGHVVLAAKAADKLMERTVNNDGVIQARSVSKKNGVIQLLGGDEGLTYNAGTLDVSGAGAGETGGRVEALGKAVHIAGSAVVDASGDQGGGTVLIGGDYQGQNQAVQNAALTGVDKDAVIKVDALRYGNAGEAIIWADFSTFFDGTVSARGGEQGGNGGFVEVSGRDYLGFKGFVDTRAAHGETGTLLLDPANITILNGSGDGGSDGTATFRGAATPGTIASGNAGPTTLYESELEGIAATTNISVAVTNGITMNDLADGVLNLAQTSPRTVTFTTGAGGFTMADTSDIIATAGGTLNFTSTGGVTLGGLSTAGGLITLNVGAASTVGGTISGTATALTKTGTGSLTLSGTNTYTGNTTITAGTLIAGNNAAFGTGTIVLNAGTLQGDGTARTFANNLSIAAATSTIGGASDLTFNNPFTNTYAGNPTLTISNTGLTTFQDVNLANAAANRTLLLSVAGNAAINGVVANGGTSTASSLHKLGSGTLTLSGANTYAGTTTFTSGIVDIQNNAAFGASALSFAGGTINNDTVARTFSNTISLDGNSTLAGSGALTFNGTMTATNNRTLTNNNTAGATFNAINLSNSSASRTLTIAGTGNTAITGTVANGGTATTSAIAKSGTSTLTLSGNNTYGGTTTVNSGSTLIAAGATALGTGALVLNGGSFEGTGAGLTFSNSVTLNANSTISGSTPLTFNGGLRGISTSLTLTNNSTGLLRFANAAITNGATSRTLTFTGSGNTTITGPVYNGGTSTGSGLIKAGSGVLTLNTGNTYGGTTVINGGTLRFAADDVFGSNTVTVNDGGTLDLNGYSDVVGALVVNSGVTGGTVITGAGVLAPTSITSSGGGTNATILGNINLGTSARTITTTNAADGLTISGVISSGAGGGLTKAGTGTLVLSNANTYLGNTTLTAGTLSAGHDSALGAGTLVLNGGTLEADGAARTFANPVSLFVNSTIGGSHHLQFNGVFTNTAAGNRVITISNTGLTTFGNVALSNSASSRTVTFAGNGNTVVSGIVSNGGTATASNIIKTGTGKLTLSGLNTYGGTTTVNGGALSVNTLANGGVASSIGQSSNAAANLVLGGATLEYTGATASTNRNFTLTAGTSNTVDITNAATTLTMSGASTATTGALTKAGDGTLVLSGANLYTGTTTVADGTLRLGGAERLANTSALTVASGAVFNLNGYNETLARIDSNGEVIFGTGNTLTTSLDQIYTGRVSGGAVTLASTGGGAIEATNALNDFTGNVSVTTTGDVHITDANSLSLGIVSASHFSAFANAGNLTLNGAVTASHATGDTLVLSASDNFINNAGASALNTQAGARWLVYSQSPLTDILGGLTRSFKQYDAVYGDTVLGTGNGSLYAFAPIINVTITGAVTKAYDGTTSATLTDADYTKTGEIDGDVAVLTYPSSGSFDTPASGTGKTVTASGVTLNSVSNGAMMVYGYQVASGDASGAVGTITPPPVEVTGPVNNDLATIRQVREISSALSHKAVELFMDEASPSAFAPYFGFTTSVDFMIYDLYGMADDLWDLDEGYYMDVDASLQSREEKKFLRNLPEDE